MAIKPNRDSTPIWRKSRLSGESGGCVEVARFGSSVLVRDSRAQSETILQFSQDRWRGFVSRVKSGKAELG